MTLSISIVAGEEAGRRLQLEPVPGTPILIGRGEECDVPLWDEAASRRHALLETRSDGRPYLIVVGKSMTAILLLNPRNRLHRNTVDDTPATTARRTIDQQRPTVATGHVRLSEQPLRRKASIV